MRGLVWFRRDLRLHDQPALTAACQECDEVLPLFVFDEPLLQSREFGSACVNFMLGCLHELSTSLAGRGLVLQWRRGEPVEAVVQAARESKAEVVYWNRDYEPAAIERDRRVQLALAEQGIRTQTFTDHVVFETEEIRGATGDPLQRYSAYRARWWAKWQAAKPSPLASPKPKASTVVPSRSAPRPFPSPVELGYDRVVPWIDPGEREAQRRLQEFLGNAIHTYGDGRNRPGVDGSSRLSPHFRFGTLSVRTAVHEALAALAQGGRVSRADVLIWIDELVWREFFQQVLAAFPWVVAGPFRAVAVPPVREPGLERDRLFQAWCQGRTGFPIVDAGMRQLHQTGWMHNRVRMIVASFLIKDLRIDWQSGERYFMQQLLDADVGANNGNWQWCAGTGTDAMPGYRIFNPALQSKKFDREGLYIRAYVPELAKVTGKWIHEPHLMTPDEQDRAGCRIGVDYPAPLVDHAQARREYLDLGKQQVMR
ncbi:cryptochrome/photolyase family protein [Nitrospira lenta]|uniref:Deoxyribodipyrimidine photo-lyase n=1 Tax=Nitrospira lenta TaxID=1436998 RepID=A0A330L5L7_9BACT|nr:deoxyribodipyrimidine photo-lyase [Nitrospira lenta]SPP64472.1 Deoxyribodipyrimidine photo-lyase [Nitrospira lenta]